MANIKVILDPVGNAMNIWWDDPRTGVISEETASPYANDVIVKNRHGIPIGLEIIGVFPDELNVVKLLKKRFPLVPYEPFILEADGSKKADNAQA